MSARAETVERLRKARPRRPFLRFSVAALAAAGVGAVGSVAGGLGDALSGRRLANLARFMREDAMPEPLRGGGSFADLLAWARGLWTAGAGEAVATTLFIAVVAIACAGAAGALVALVGARELAAEDPFSSSAEAGRPTRRRALAAAVRFLAVLARAVPEYLLAFLFLALFGSHAWPAILALALHNAGILGRLGAEAVEDLERPPLRALVRLGARRDALALAGVLPLAFGRFLLFFLYRFETCLREATVLGMLGIVSLGAAVEEARARQRYDELLFLLACAGVLVLAADLLSSATRRWLRRAT